MLVRNLGERGGPGKLQSFWENKTYVVKEQIFDNPVYVIHHRGRSKTLHRNLLLLSNDLPVQFSQQPTKPTSQPAKKQAKARDKLWNRREQTENIENSNSDDDSANGYWLRVPPTWAVPRAAVDLDKPDASQEERSLQTHRRGDELGQRMPVAEAQGRNESWICQIWLRPMREVSFFPRAVAALNASNTTIP